MNKPLPIITGIMLGLYSLGLFFELGLMAMCGSVCTTGLSLVMLAVVGFGLLQWILYVLAVVYKQTWLQIVLLVVPPIFIVLSLLSTALVT